MLSPFLYKHSTTHSFNSIIKVADDTAIISLITKVNMEYKEELLQRRASRTKERIIESCGVEDTTPSPLSVESPHLQVPLSSHHRGSDLGYNKTTNKTTALLPQKNETRWPTGYSAKCTGESILTGCITAPWGRNSLYM